MYLISVDDGREDGVYSIVNKQNDHILIVFEEEDDALRYSGMLESEGYPPMKPTEIEYDVLMKICNYHGYKFCRIKEDDIIVPPKI